MVPEEASDLARSTAPKRRAILTLERALWIMAILMTLTSGMTTRVRIASNEAAAIGTLRTLSTSQAGFQSAGIVDADGDGVGEFGFMTELAGVTCFRSDPRGGAPGVSSLPTSPAFITTLLGTTAAANHGVAQKSGYFFLVYLPTAAGPATPETGQTVRGNPADADAQEVRFACYAWPVVLGQTGRRAFVVTQQGEVFATQNQGRQDYEGLERRPPPDAALCDSKTQNLKNLVGTLVARSWAADGFNWVPAGN